MNSTGKFSRRALAKGLAATGIVTGLSRLQGEDGGEQQTSAKTSMPQPQELVWEPMHPGVWRARLAVPEAYTPVSQRLVASRVDALSHLPTVRVAPISLIHAAVTNRGCTLQLPLRPQEQVYGLGLQMHSFLQRGKKKVVRVNADPKADTGDSHAPVPFYVTTAGYGVLIDTARYATFYFGDARLKPSRPEASVTADSEDPNYTHNLQDSDAGLVTVEVPRATGVDVYLFGGPTMLDAVRRYNMFSGGGVEPPEWGLGFWYRPESRATQQNVLALAQTFRTDKIPCDVVGLEAGWQTHAYACTFAWNPDRFPSPPSMLRDLQSLGYKVNLWQHAFTHPASAVFPQMLPHAGDYGVWGGLVPDFASESGRETFGDFQGRTLIDLGICGFKLDECDNSDYTGGWSFPELSRFPSGIDGEQMHNVFGLRYQDTLWEQYRKRKRDTYSLVRSSGALASPYPFVLYSDLYEHRQFIRALVNSGFSGLLWCPEVRDATGVEDLLRRLQSVVFSPLAMVNGWYIKSPPWKQLNRKLNNAGQHMANWEQVQARCREIIGWRMQLVPYLRAAFARYAAGGTPPFRALVLDHPDESPLHAVDDTYYIGDRMVVAPLFAGEPSRDIMLPAGEWHDFWTGEKITSGHPFSVSASQEKIPVYVKTGSVIPWSNVGMHAGDAESRKLSIRVYGDGSLPFVLGAGEPELELRWDAAGKRGHSQGTTQPTYDIVRWEEIG